MTETAIKSNKAEAERLFQRGVAAARGGQRRVAAGLLSRAVQLDPDHERGWLWLSGVLDDPQQIAFCLRSVLTINPHNERAQQGLAWLEQRAQTASQTEQYAEEVEEIESEPEADSEEYAYQEARYQGESWWVNWRRAQRDMGRVRLIAWAVPILLLSLTIALHNVLQDAVNRNQQIQISPVINVEQAFATTQQTEDIQPILQATLPISEQAQAFAYLSALEVPRERLRKAVELYRQATSQPGGSSMAHVAAAHRLREEIQAGNNEIAKLTPPPALAQSHANYLTGLELEQVALNDMLEFYTTFSISLANRASIRLEDAGTYLQQAKNDFTQYQNHNQIKQHYPFTLR
jgi:tetratricopeptide (TPR) repeat protein